MKHPFRHLDRRRAGVLVALTVALVLGLAACYPGGPDNLGDLDVIVTLKNPTGDFANMMTYAMEDTVVELKIPDDDSSEAIDWRFNAIILEEIQGQMAKAGFTREMDPGTDKPDAWVSVGAVESEVWVYTYSWGYWGGYPGWGGYYPPYISATSFQQGTLVWQMHDLRDVEDPSAPGAEPALNWVGSINGALNKYTSSSGTELRAGIQQGFTQSPYIAAQSAGK